MILPKPSEVPRVKLSEHEQERLYHFLSAPWSPAEWNNGRKLDTSTFQSQPSIISDTLRASGWDMKPHRGTKVLILPGTHSVTG